ncbi:MAG: hypothetical protein ACRYGP_10050 [Janthinobacterium lividum]
MLFVSRHTTTVMAFLLHSFGIVLPFREPLVTDSATATIGAAVVVAAARVVA